MLQEWNYIDKYKYIYIFLKMRNNERKHFWLIWSFTKLVFSLSKMFSATWKTFKFRSCMHVVLYCCYCCCCFYIIELFYYLNMALMSLLASRTTESISSFLSNEMTEPLFMTSLVMIIRISRPTLGQLTLICWHRINSISLWSCHYTWSVVFCPL